MHTLELNDPAINTTATIFYPDIDVARQASEISVRDVGCAVCAAALHLYGVHVGGVILGGVRIGGVCIGRVRVWEMRGRVQRRVCCVYYLSTELLTFRLAYEHLYRGFATQLKKALYSSGTFDGKLVNIICSTSPTLRNATRKLSTSFSDFSAATAVFGSAKPFATRESACFVSAILASGTATTMFSLCATERATQSSIWAVRTAAHFTTAETLQRRGVTTRTTEGEDMWR